MNNNETKVGTLISLYNLLIAEITYYQNEGDSTDVMNVIPIAIIPMLEVFDVNPFIISMVCLFAPLIQCLSLQRGIQAHTFVAMLRGYAAIVEETINELTGEKFFLYNSVLVDEYIASDKVVKSKGLKTSWFITTLMHIAIWCICVLFFIYFNIKHPWWILTLASIWFVTVAVFIITLCIKFSKKEKKRFDSRYLVKEIIKEK